MINISFFLESTPALKAGTIGTDDFGEERTEGNA